MNAEKKRDVGGFWLCVFLMIFILTLSQCHKAKAQVSGGNEPLSYHFFPTHIAKIPSRLVDSALYNTKLDQTFTLDTLCSDSCQRIYARQNSLIIAIVICLPRTDMRTVFSRSEFISLFGLTVHFNPWEISVGFR